jgi:hypothetical protein
VGLGGKPAARPAPNRVEMHPRGANLRVEVFDALNRLVCRLDVLAPKPESSGALLRMIVVRTSVFSCPGEGEKFR